MPRPLPAYFSYNRCAQLISSYRLGRGRSKLALLLCVLLAIMTASAGQGIAPRAVIDTRAYSVCKLIGANRTGGIIQGAFGTVKKPEMRISNIITWNCTGTGIQNDSGRDLAFFGFNCTVIDGAGAQFLTQNTSAALTAKGAENLRCTYNVTG